mmetsp:Transcript_2653/g.7988  ORF Transcript_2653/g.7988 Transcript_2653/m.7988 type:complete len:232 (+) Transcript_2653:1319-2014(+)
MQVYQRPLDRSHPPSLAPLHVHHHCQGISTADPFLRRQRETADGCSIAAISALNESTRRVAKGIAVIAVKVGGQGAPPLVAKVVADGSEAAAVLPLGLSLPQLDLHVFGQEPLCLYLAELHVAVWVSFEQKLSRKSGRHALVGLLRRTGQVRNDVFLAIQALCQDLVELQNQCSDVLDKLNEALGDDNHTKVLVLRRSSAHQVCNVICDVLQCPLARSHFLAYQAHVWSCL